MFKRCGNKPFRSYNLLLRPGMFLFSQKPMYGRFRGLSLLKRLFLVVFLFTTGYGIAQSSPSVTSAQSQASDNAKKVSQAPTLSKSPDQKLAEAESLIEKGELNQAEALMRQDEKISPNSGTAHFLLGYILYKEIQTEAKRIDPNPNAIYAAPGKSLIELREKNAKES